MITSSRESQLSAGHLSIRSTPEVITHSAPDIVVADLHTTLHGSASLESDGSLSASTASSSTPHASIFKMSTVVAPQCISGTVNESGLSSTTLDIIQPNLTSTIGEPRGYGSSTYQKIECKYVLSNNKVAHQWSRIPAVCRPPEHQEYPRSHHTPCPRHCCCRPPHDHC